MASQSDLTALAATLQEAAQALLATRRIPRKNQRPNSLYAEMTGQPAPSTSPRQRCIWKKSFCRNTVRTTFKGC